MAQRATSKIDTAPYKLHLTVMAKIGTAAIEAHHRIDNDDHLAFMTLSFVAKQLLHAESVLVLDPHPDTQLIARSMLEGTSQLFWAKEEPDTRPWRWRMFAHVLDWRTIRLHDEAGTPVPTAQRQGTDDWLQSHGHHFWTSRAKGLIAAGNVPNDPYSMNWYDEREKQIFEAVDGGLLYRDLYGPFSEWHHWRIGGFGPLIRFDDKTNTFTMSGDAPSATAAALTVAVQCLWQTLKAADEIVDLGIELELQRIYRDYTADFVATPRT